MRRDLEDERAIRRYLLDDLTPEERRRLEERLLDDGDNDFFEQMQLAEAELADDYVTGDLSGPERARFAESFLSTAERHEQLRFAELLRGHFAADEPFKKTVTAEARPPSSWLEKLSLLLGLGRPAVGFALACGLVLAVAAAALLGLRAWQLGRRLDQLQARQAPTPSGSDAALARAQQQLEEERARRESAAQELAGERERRAGLEQEVARLKEHGRGETVAAKPPPGRDAERPAERGTAGSTLALALTSGLVRDPGAATPSLRLTPEAETVRLRLDVGADDYQSFRAALEDAEGKTLLARGALRARAARGGRAVTFDVPARLLEGGGDFQAILSGVTREGSAVKVGTYNFRVTRQ